MGSRTREHVSGAQSKRNWTRKKVLFSTWLGIACSGLALAAVAASGAMSSDMPAPSEEMAVAAQTYPSPVITLTSPAAGGYTSPTSLVLAADAEPGGDGPRITKVEFYVNGALLVTDSSMPFSYTWSNTPVGAYTIYAVAYDNVGGSAGSGSVNVNVSAPANQLPTVSLTSPANNAIVLAGSTVSLNANASDSDGTINKVEFYDRGTLLAVDYSSPYQMSWPANSLGTYGFYARAYDNAGGARDSATSTVIVNQPPTAFLNAPVTGTVFQASSSIQIDAGASDVDGSIDHVEFYNGAQFLASDNSVPYGYTWPNVSAGTYTLTVRSYDNYGASKTSASSTITVNRAPSVSISAPASGAIVHAPATVLVQASASDADDSVWKVEFYRNGALISTDDAAPFEVQWPGLPAGTYTLTAKAYDTRGGTATSAASTLIVNALPTVNLTSPADGTLINAPNSYTLSANASDSDGTIKRVEFYNGTTLVATDDVAPYSYVWPSILAGTYHITAKAIDNRDGITTSNVSKLILNEPPVVSISSPVSNSIVVAPADVLIETNATDVDDSVSTVEFYIDGIYQATDTEAPFALESKKMKAGTYTLTAKAFDSRGGATVSQASTLIVNEAPQVQLVSPGSNTGVLVPQEMTLAATAGDADGTIDRVEFYSGGTLLGTASTAPFQIPWTVTAAGDIALTAKAYDNRGTSTTSTAVMLRARVNAFELIEDGARPSLLGELPAHDPTIGKLAGTPGVSGGAATYEIPIAVPPGRRGMEPQLALSYSSRNGAGVAGMGWSLSGLSSLHRCPATPEQDGRVAAVTLTNADKLCLDGQRLVVTSGTYGQAGATYATELQSFVRVTQLGGDLTSMSTHFKVERKSGEIAYYGSTSTASSPARVVPGGKSVPLSWLIARTQDRISNTIDYVYTAYGDGETLIQFIYYTGFGSTQGDRRVAFTYQDRPTGAGANDRSSTYLAGGVTRQTKRLSAITTSVGSEWVRSYVLDYGTGVSSTTGRSLLRSISDCAHDGTQWVCKAPTMLTWQEGAPTYSLSVPDLGPQLNALPEKKILPAGDFDGDGASEIIVQATGQSYIVSLSADRQVRWTMPMPAEYFGLYVQKLQDFNQDGRVDLIGKDVNNNLLIRFWSGSPTDTQFSTAFGTVWNTGLHMPDAGAYIAHVGDMDGDGRADLVLGNAPGVNTDTCHFRVNIYRNTPNPSAPWSAPTFPLMAQHCLAGHNNGGQWDSEAVRVQDFDGDGLPDLWIDSLPQYGANWAEKGRALDRIVFGRRNPTYSLQVADFSSLFTSAEPAYQHELNPGLFAFWTDVNGDGLDDFVYANTAAKWVLRLNRGGVLGPRYVFNNSLGIMRCSSGYCDEAWQPWRASKFSVADIDGDGRMEILVPTRFAANICAVYQPNNGVACQGEDGGSNMECRARTACSEDPATNGPVMGPAGQLDFDLDGDGTPETRQNAGPFIGVYANGYPDYSTYFMTALRFVETSPGTIELRQVPTDLVSNENGHQEDLYGDGHTDLITSVAAPFSNPEIIGIPAVRGDGTVVPESLSPRTLPNGIPVLSRSMIVNENLGPGGFRNPDRHTPQTQDILSMVTDGLGVQTIWTHYPLASKAGRGAGQTPLYTLPLDAASRYIDEHHIYFASSMPVVSDMIQSDGNGDYHAWRYAYTEAMYNTQGRGFQGFRSIIEEDEANGLRTSTIFHQKFPLTSQPEWVVVNPIARPGISGAIKSEQYIWRCNLAYRDDASACAPNMGTPQTYFPYLDTKETWSFDATTAANPSGGAPAVLGYAKEVAASDATCTGSFSTASGYDAYGNLTATTTHQYDVGSGTGGARNFLDDHCVTQANTYAASTSDWWLDKLIHKTVTTRVAWDATKHAMPAGTANPTQSISSDYTWNTDRTLASETLQPGVSNQQRVTAYTYPTSNYGLPETVSITASGDPNGTRTTRTTYTADGYFPATITNAVNHTVTTAVRARDGQPTSAVDPNGQRTLMAYDAFGTQVLKQFRGPNGTDYRAPDQYTAVSACSGCSAGQLYQVTQVQDGTPTIRTRFDMLARPRLKSEKQVDGVWTSIATEYTARGLVARQSEPYRDGETTTYWTQFTQYDLLGRPLRKVVPKQAEDGRGDLVTNYVYDGRTTRIQVCGSADSGTNGCLNLSRTTDSLGRYVETLDAQGGRTRFWYESLGNVAAIEDAKGVVTRAAYNSLGQRMSVDDPNQGHWSFAYNALGELLGQTDARNISTGFVYDKLGRMTSRNATVDETGDGVADTVADSWSYDPANALGQLLSDQRSINGTLERSTTLTYDGLSRPVQTDIVQAMTSGTQSYRMRQRYDSYYGRPNGQEFPNGEAVEARYSSYGHALSERDPATGSIYRELGGVNARGQATLETFGGGALQTQPDYWVATGQVKQLLQKANGIEVRRLDYGYDVFGNVRRQTLNAGQSEERYGYDTLQRLTEATRTGAATGTVAYGYDAVGNFTHKSDFSLVANNAYSYGGGSCGGGANAVTSVQLMGGGTRTYCYDANGNLTSDSAGLSLKYDHQNLPIVAMRGALRDDFRYGTDGKRVRSWGSDGARVYLPGYEHRTDTGETKVYVGDYAVISKSGGTRKVEYLLKDRLGSIDAVANSSGSVTETRGYDAFGKPRSGTWGDLNPARLQNVSATPKGFTQHEHLNQIELIHMNGRVFDYNLGRFTGVDPFIQFPLNSQSLNPYSYVLNNPLSGTDPTGYRSQGSVCDVGSKGNNGNGCSSITVMPASGNSSKPKKTNTDNGGNAGGAGTTDQARKADAQPNEKQRGTNDQNANGAVSGVVADELSGSDQKDLSTTERRRGGWTAKGVQKILERTAQGQAFLKALQESKVPVVSFRGASDTVEDSNGRMVTKDLSDGLEGNYDPESKTIRLNASLTSERATLALYHEFQHHLGAKEPEARVLAEQFAIDTGMETTSPGYRTSANTVNVELIQSQLKPGGVLSDHYRPQVRIRKYWGEKNVSF